MVVHDVVVVGAQEHEVARPGSARRSVVAAATFAGRFPTLCEQPDDADDDDDGHEHRSDQDDVSDGTAAAPRQRG